MPNILVRSILLLGMFFLPLVSVPTAHAYTRTQYATPCNIGTWDWITAVQAIDPGFNPSTDSYLLFQREDNGRYNYVTTSTSPTDKPGLSDTTVYSSPSNAQRAQWDSSFNNIEPLSSIAGDSPFTSAQCSISSMNWANYGWSGDPPPSYTTTPPPTDLCSNIEGTQETIPTDKEDPNNDGICTDIVVTPPPDPDPPTPNNEQITFFQKISAIFTFALTALIAKQFVFRMYD